MLDLNQRPSPCQGDALTNYANRNQKWSFPGDSDPEPSPCEGAALTKLGEGTLGWLSGLGPLT